jgi:hypothetical protein
MSFDDKFAGIYFDEIKGYIKPSHERQPCEFCRKSTNWAILRFGVTDTPAGYDYTYCCSEACLDAFKAELVEEITGGSKRISLTFKGADKY